MSKACQPGGKCPISRGSTAQLWGELGAPPTDPGNPSLPSPAAAPAALGVHAWRQHGKEPTGTRCVACPLRRSHSRTVPSAPPVARVSPLCWWHSTSALWPLSSWSRAPDCPVLALRGRVGGRQGGASVGQLLRAAAHFRSGAAVHCRCTAPAAAHRSRLHTLTRPALVPATSRPVSRCRVGSRASLDAAAGPAHREAVGHSGGGGRALPGRRVSTRRLCAQVGPSSSSAHPPASSRGAHSLRRLARRRHTARRPAAGSRCWREGPRAPAAPAPAQAVPRLSRPGRLHARLGGPPAPPPRCRCPAQAPSPTLPPAGVPAQCRTAPTARQHQSRPPPPPGRRPCRGT